MGLKLVKTDVSKLGFFKISLTKACLQKLGTDRVRKLLFTISKIHLPKQSKIYVIKMCGNNTQRVSCSLQRCDYIH